MEISVKFVNFTDYKQPLTALFAACFPEDAAFAPILLQGLPNTVECVAVFADGEMASALYLIPASLQVAGKTFRVKYVYGVGTLPQFRHRGFAKLALQETATQVDADALILYPAKPSLRAFYHTCGYLDTFHAQTVNMQISAAVPYAIDGVTPFCACVYQEMRRAFLSKQPTAHMVFEDAVMQLLLSHAQIVQFTEGAALIVVENDTVHVPELLCDTACLDRVAATLFTLYPNKKLSITVPHFEQPYAMALPLSACAREILTAQSIPLFTTIFQV